MSWWNADQDLERAVKFSSGFSNCGAERGAEIASDNSICEDVVTAVRLKPVAKPRYLTPRSPTWRVQIDTTPAVSDSPCTADLAPDDNGFVASPGAIEPPSVDGPISRKRSIKEIKSQLENRSRVPVDSSKDDKKVSGDSVSTTSSVAERRRRFQTSASTSVENGSVTMRQNPERCLGHQ